MTRAHRAGVRDELVEGSDGPSERGMSEFVREAIVRPMATLG